MTINFSYYFLFVFSKKHEEKIKIHEEKIKFSLHLLMSTFYGKPVVKFSCN